MTLTGPDYAQMTLRMEGSDRLLVRVACARTSAASRRGLLGLDAIELGRGLLMRGCPVIHMAGMRVALDVVFLDRRGRIHRVFADVAPGLRFRGCLRGWRCLELAAGEAARLGLRAGTRVVLQDA